MLPTSRASEPQLPATPDHRKRPLQRQNAFVAYSGTPPSANIKAMLAIAPSSNPFNSGPSDIGTVMHVQERPAKRRREHMKQELSLCHFLIQHSIKSIATMNLEQALDAFSQIEGEPSDASHNDLRTHVISKIEEHSLAELRPHLPRLHPFLPSLQVKVATAIETSAFTWEIAQPLLQTVLSGLKLNRDSTSSDLLAQIEEGIIPLVPQMSLRELTSLANTRSKVRHLPLPSSALMKAMLTRSMTFADELITSEQVFTALSNLDHPIRWDQPLSAVMGIYLCAQTLSVVKNMDAGELCGLVETLGMNDSQRLESVLKHHDKFAAVIDLMKAVHKRRSAIDDMFSVLQRTIIDIMHNHITKWEQQKKAMPAFNLAVKLVT